MLSKGRLAFCDVNAFISNTTKEQLSKNHIRAVYGLRWQIEIYFKTWKSYMNIDKIEKMNIDRFNSTHYASLIYLVFSTKLFLFFKQRVWKKHRKEINELYHLSRKFTQLKRAFFALASIEKITVGPAMLMF